MKNKDTVNITQSYKQELVVTNYKKNINLITKEIRWNIFRNYSRKIKVRFYRQKGLFGPHFTVNRNRKGIKWKTETNL